MNKFITTDDLTDEQITALRSEAAAAGDPEMVDACDRALDGDGGARRNVVAAINDARAAADDEPPQGILVILTDVTPNWGSVAVVVETTDDLELAGEADLVRLAPEGVEVGQRVRLAACEEPPADYAAYLS